MEAELGDPAELDTDVVETVSEAAEDESEDEKALELKMEVIDILADPESSA